MEVEWKHGTLGEVGDVIMGQSPPGANCSSEKIGIPLLNGPTEFGGHHPEPTQFTDQPKKFSEIGDILFCVRGSTTGRMNWSNQRYAIGRGLAAIRHKDIECQQFLRGLIDNKLDEILALATGSTFPNVSRNQLLETELLVPPLPEQKAIAHVLGSLDDKIELNRRINETLEGMAQALFKSWFVDFDPVIDNALAAGNPIPEPLAQRAETRSQALANGTANRETALAFPASFRFTEELGWIPEGWEVKEANEAADISIGKTPPRKQQEWFSDISSGNIVWVSIKDMGTCGVFINDSSEYLTSESIEKFNVKVVPKGSVILSFKLTVGRVAIADTSLATNEAIAHFTDLKNGLTKEFIYSYLKQFDYNDLGSTSSIATAVNSKIIKAMPVLIPHVQVLAAFSQNCQNWFGLIRNQQYQSQTLAKLRDVLLPKLISGELRIPQAEKMVKEAIV
jgi:type I restriction enzyme S subunit